MSENTSGLDAFLKTRKRGKKGNKGKNPADKDQTEANKLTDALNADGEEAKVQDNEDGPTKNQTSTGKANPTQDASSDDEDVEELVIQSNHIIREKKDVDQRNQQADKRQDMDTLFVNDDQTTTKTGATAGAGAKDPKAKQKGGPITFGSKPQFGRRTKQGGLGGAFNQGLDDIDDDGSNKNKKAAKGGDGNTGDGTREFINLGASARQGGDKRTQEEDKQGEKRGAVKPTFRGKLNLTRTGGGGQEEENEGVVTSYGFNVALRGPQQDKDKKDEGHEGQTRNQGRKFGRDKGQPFSHAAKQTEGFDDDGFEVVQDRDRKRRAHRQRNANDSDSDSDGGQQDTRGGFRGGRGGGNTRGSWGRGGGMFKNSRKEREAAGDKAE